MWAFAALFLLAAYVAASYILFRYPWILYRPKVPQLGWPVHISHRGGAGERIESTLEAFQHAVALGTDMLELDCRLTKDGQVIVLHDDNLKRCTGLDVAVGDINYRDIPPCLKELPVQFSPGSYCRVQGNVGRRILLLKTLLAAFPNTPMNIDIKEDNDELIEKITALIRQFQREHITICGSFHDSVSWKLRQTLPKLSQFFPMQSVYLVYISYYLGLLPFMPLHHDYFELPIMLDILFSTPDESKKPDHIATRIVYRALNMLMKNRKLNTHLVKRGIPVIFWVCNTEADFDTVFRIGGHGIITDYPTQLKAFLLKRNWEPHKPTTGSLHIADDSVTQQPKVANSSTTLTRRSCRTAATCSELSEWRTFGD